MAIMCAIADCLLPTHAGGLHCAGHAKRLERGQATTAPLREKLPLRERVLKLVNDLADADSENDAAYEAAWDALRKALEQWAREGLARKAVLARWAKLSPAQRSAEMRKVRRTGTWSAKRHRVKRAGKRRGAPP